MKNNKCISASRHLSISAPRHLGISASRRLSRAAEQPSSRVAFKCRSLASLGMTIVFAAVCSSKSTTTTNKAGGEAAETDNTPKNITLTEDQRARIQLVTVQ